MGLLNEAVPPFACPLFDTLVALCRAVAEQLKLCIHIKYYYIRSTLYRRPITSDLLKHELELLLYVVSVLAVLAVVPS